MATRERKSRTRGTSVIRIQDAVMEEALKLRPESLSWMNDSAWITYVVTVGVKTLKEKGVDLELAANVSR